MASLFIVRYPERPVQVPANGRVAIGRAESNTIVLTESRVSRLHALIEWREGKGGFVILDLGSANGTVLNGERIYPSNEYALKDWDKFRIASAVFTVRIVDSQDIIQREFQEVSQRIHGEATQIVSRAAMQGADAQPALSGALEHLCPIDLFQMLEFGRKTGTLVLTTEAAHATFTILKGMVVDARYGEVRGEQAVFAVLAINHGTFTFSPHQESGVESHITKPTTMLLMEGCRLLDEANSAGAKT